jgi:thiamine-phosphate pyrophosphorylase
MTNEETSEKIERLIDANLNRLKEGIRVIEDINRYIFDDEDLSSTLKQLRHTLQPAYDQTRLRYRDIENDVLKKSISSELNRTSINDLMIANFHGHKSLHVYLKRVLNSQTPPILNFSKHCVISFML